MIPSLTNLGFAIGFAVVIAFTLRGSERWRSWSRSAALALFAIIVTWLGLLPDPDPKTPPPFPFWGDFSTHYGMFFRQIPNVFLFFVPSIIALHWCERHRFQDLRRKKVEEILLEDLNAIFGQIPIKKRSTIFLPCGKLRVLSHLAWFCLLRNFCAHFNRGLLGFYFLEFCRILGRSGRSYLTIFARSGQVNNKSSTYFLAPNYDKEVDGIVPYVWLDQRQYFAFFPSVADFSSPPYPKRLSEISSKSLKRKMKNYLQDGKFRASRDKDPDLRKIWAIHWHASNVWATPIQRDDSPNPIGILVMECDSTEDVFKENSDLAGKLQDTPKKIYHWLTLEG